MSPRDSLSLRVWAPRLHDDHALATTAALTPTLFQREREKNENP